MAEVAANRPFTVRSTLGLSALGPLSLSPLRLVLLVTLPFHGPCRSGIQGPD